MSDSIHDDSLLYVDSCCGEGINVSKMSYSVKYLKELQKDHDIKIALKSFSIDEVLFKITALNNALTWAERLDNDPLQIRNCTGHLTIGFYTTVQLIAHIKIIMEDQSIATGYTTGYEASFISGRVTITAPITPGTAAEDAALVLQTATALAVTNAADALLSAYVAAHAAAATQATKDTLTAAYLAAKNTAETAAATAKAIADVATPVKKLRHFRPTNLSDNLKTWYTLGFEVLPVREFEITHMATLRSFNARITKLNIYTNLIKSSTYDIRQNQQNNLIVNNLYLDFSDPTKDNFEHNEHNLIFHSANKLNFQSFYIHLKDSGGADYDTHRHTTYYMCFVIRHQLKQSVIRKSMTITKNEIIGIVQEMIKEKAKNNKLTVEKKLKIKKPALPIKK
jgi:hypothetical protein